MFTIHKANKRFNMFRSFEQTKTAICIPFNTGLNILG